jgi:hypothetical protein
MGDGDTTLMRVPLHLVEHVQALLRQGAEVAPSLTAMECASEPLEWERFMWAVLWDTQPDDKPRRRHLCMAVGHDGYYGHHPAMFLTKREAQQHINRFFGWCRWEQHRKPPQNNRLPKPYRVRVRITIPQEPPHA